MRILTGLKPTADQIHLGNFFGAIKPFIAQVDAHPDSENFLFIASLHALTTLHDRSIASNTRALLKTYLAAGLDPARVTLYDQLDIPAHSQAQRVTACLTHMGFMERMHAFKDAIAKKKANEVSVGTFCYPILMAMDILLYDIDLVPVGKDQKQHVEFARDFAQKFNSQFGETFVVPAPLVKEEIATIPGIDGRKMSKSYNNFIGLLDDEKTIHKKIKQISTDSLGIDDPKNPDTCTLFQILKLFLTPEEESTRRERYTAGGLSYREAKDFLFEKIRAFLSDFQHKFWEVSDAEVDEILRDGAERARAIATPKMEQIYRAVGLRG